MDGSVFGWHQLYDWFGFNRFLFESINALHSPRWDAFMFAVTEAADHRLFPWYMAAILFIAHIAPRIVPFSNGLVFGLGYGASWVIVGYVKNALAMPRPVAVLGAHAVHVVGPVRLENTMPSGHTVFAFMLAAALSPGAPAGVKVLLWTFAALAGLSRIAVGAHFPADVIAGALIGVGIAGAIHLAIQVVRRTRA